MILGLISPHLCSTCQFYRTPLLYPQRPNVCRRALRNHLHVLLGSHRCRALLGTKASDNVNAPKFNPQNTENAMVGPSIDADAVEAVTAQLEALSHNDAPWWNHGVQTAYEYGIDFGSMEPSYYFGSRKDVYHQDHVAGQFRSSYMELVNSKSFDIVEVLDLGDDMRCMVEVSVESPSQQRHRFVFCMRRATIGRKKGCWMTKMLVRGDIAAAQALIARLQKGIE